MTESKLYEKIGILSIQVEEFREMFEKARDKNDDLETEVFNLRQRLLTVEKDFQELIKRADLSDIGSNTPNPF